MSRGKTRSLSLDGHDLKLTSLDKVFFPHAGITKGDLVDYYRRIARVALPHYRGRALTQQRFPDGIGEEGFFQKQTPDHYPDWIARATLPKEDGQTTYVTVEDAASLVYLANQGMVTPHLALSRSDKPDHPDRMVFDLDPSDGDFEKVRFAARRLKDALDELELPAFLQTTGSRGLHVVVPLTREWNFDQVRGFARNLAGLLADRHPDRLTVEQRKNKRGDRVFLDILRNAYGQTAVAPYGVRAKPGAPVATPLSWAELDRPGLTPQRYTLKNIFRRLGAKQDPWREMDRKAVALSEAARHLGELYN